MTYQIKSTQDIVAFRAAVLPFLRPQAARLSQLLLLCERLTAPALEAEPYWLAYLCEGEGAEERVAAVAILSCLPSSRYLSLSEWPAQSLPLLTDALASMQVEVLVGPQATAQACSAALGLSHLRTHLVNYVLETAPVAQPAAGEARALAREDFVLLADWIVAFEIECNFPARPAAAVLANLQNAQPPFGNRQYDLWTVNGAAVAMSAMSLVGTTARIGPVYTPPEQRGRGYAGAVVFCQAARAMAQGAERVCLYADAANPVSNGLYRRIGFVEQGEFGEYALNS